jgi:hypothetical protein
VLSGCLFKKRALAVGIATAGSNLGESIVFKGRLPYGVVNGEEGRYLPSHFPSVRTSSRIQMGNKGDSIHHARYTHTAGMRYEDAQ